MALAHTLSPTCSDNRRLASSRRSTVRQQDPRGQECRLISSSPLSRQPKPVPRPASPSGQLPDESASGRMSPGRDGGRTKSKPRNASVAAPFGDPYMVRVSGDFLPKLCVVTSARMSVCKLRLQFVERGVGERKSMDSRCRTFYCPR